MGARRGLNGIFTVLSVIAGVIVVAFLVLCLLGLRPFVLRSGSMEPLYPTGSLCLVDTRKSVADLEVGDVVVYRETTGVRVMHRLVDETNGYVLKGDAATTEKTVQLDDGTLIGVTVFSIPKIGFIIKAMGRYRLIFIGVAILLLVLAALPKKKRITGQTTP